MTQEVVESLHALGYDGECLDASVLGEALADGLKSTVLRSLIVWIANDLADSLLLDDSIHPDSNLGDFLIELNRLLKEIYCPYASMTAGPSDERFSSAEQLISLLNYMLSEQMAARMADRKRMKTIDESKAAKSPPTASLRRISRSLNVPVPQSASVKTLFETIFSKLNASMKSKSFGKPLFVPSKALTSEKWVQLEKSRQELDREYDLRREMLVTRLDVTVQSFQWADAIKLKENAIAERYRTKRSELNALKRGGHSTDISELLAARDDLLFVEKTSSGTVQQNTKCNIQKHMIGAVPDRGGRTSELAPPPPEMPSWQKNRATGPSGGHRGGQNQGFHQNQRPQQQRNQHNKQNYQNNFNNQSSQPHYNSRGRGGGGGGRVQGGWSQGGDRDFGNQQYSRGGGGDAGQSNWNRQDQNDGYSRGRSSYNRGGRR